MFFVPLPLDRTLQTIEDVESNASVGLPDPEIYVLVSGKPSKNKLLWQSLVNVGHVRAAVEKLREINWLYTAVDDSSVDDASRRIVESVSDTTSSMLVKVSAEDISSFQAYTIRRLDQKWGEMRGDIVGKGIWEGGKVGEGGKGEEEEGERKHMSL